MAKVSGSNRYVAIVEDLFHDRYQTGLREVPFEREDIVKSAAKLGLDRPRNLGDLIYTFRYRQQLPDSILETAPEGETWIIRSSGTSKYRFALVTDSPLVPNSNRAVTKVPDAPPGISIEELGPGDPGWRELVEVIGEEGQAKEAFEPFFCRFPRYFVAARQGGQIVGFLMFVVWEIGPHDRRHPVVQRGGKALTEAKIIAFGVPSAYRRRGIGRALQEHVLHRARALGCYQVRSVSRWTRQANHQLKLSMGFAVEPMERDEPSLAFIMPLASGHGDSR